MKRFLIGFGFGLLFGVLVPGFLALHSYREKSSEADLSWEGKSVLVMARDAAEGAVLDESLLAEREVPSQFVTESFVPVEDRALVIGRRVQHPMQSGDPLTWSVLADQQFWKDVGACAAAAMPAIKEADRSTLDEVIAGMSGRDDAVPAPREEALAGDDGDAVQVVALKRDVREGEAIAADALVVLSMPAALVTASVVRAEHLEKVPGVIANVPMMAGDPLLWQHLDDPERIGTTAGCYLKVGNLQTERREKVAAEQAERFFAEQEERP